MSNETQYAYAVARIRAVETKLLDTSKIERMIEAKSADEALMVLIDIGYGFSAAEVKSAVQYETLLMEEHKKVYALLKELAPQPEIFDLFLLRNDYHNAKVVLKAEFLGQEYDHLLTETGTIPSNKLKIMVRERNLKEMSPIMQNAINECIDSFNRTKDPQLIDLILDRASFIQMKDIADTSKNEFLQVLVMILIDMANIKTFVRVKKLNKSWDFINKVIMPGGKLESKFYMEKLTEPFESFSEALEYSDYGKLCEEGIGSYLKTGSLTKLEKLTDDYVINYVKKAKYISLGIEPLIAYLIAKENEIKIARILMVGKINNISNEIIRERLREAYV